MVPNMTVTSLLRIHPRNEWDDTYVRLLAVWNYCLHVKQYRESVRSVSIDTQIHEGQESDIGGAVTQTARSYDINNDSAHSTHMEGRQ